MNKWMKRGIFIGIFFIITFGIFFALFKSQIGENILINYIRNKLKIVKNFETKYFNYSFNSFSLILQNGSNKIYIYGNFFPLEGVYEAEMPKIEDISENFRGKFSSKGNFKLSQYLNILGNAVFANGYANLRFQCLDRCVGVLNGVDFNTQKLLNMLKIDLPYFTGTNTLNLIIKKDFAKAIVVFNGDVDFKNLHLKDSVINTDIRFKNRDKYAAKIQIYNPDMSANLFCKKNKKYSSITGTSEVNLSLLNVFTYYPFKSKQKFDVKYQNMKILQFSNNYINGIYTLNEVNIDVNSMPSDIFFKILGIGEFFKGNVNGNILISPNEREFSFMIKNVNLLSNKVYNFISNKVSKKFNNLNVFLIKGKFDNQKVVFNIIGKKDKDNLLVSVQNGVYFYNGDYKFNVEVLLNRNKYVFSVDNGNIKVKNIIKSFSKKQEILVY